MKRWESVLTRLERDPFECADELDWVAKLKLLNSYRDRDGLDWSDAKLHLIDLQYADLRPEKGLYHRLVKRGRMKRLVDDAVVEEAMHEPPEDTRAYFRGRCLSKYADNIAAASWDSVIFDLPGHESLQRVPTIDPLRGSGPTWAPSWTSTTPRSGSSRRSPPLRSCLGPRRAQSWQVAVAALAERHLASGESSTSESPRHGASSAATEGGDPAAAVLDDLCRQVWLNASSAAGHARGCVSAASAHRCRRQPATSWPSR